MRDLCGMLFLITGFLFCSLTETLPLFLFVCALGALKGLSERNRQP